MMKNSYKNITIEFVKQPFINETIKVEFTP